MSRRIVGIETEYGITCAPHTSGKPPLDAEAAAAKLFAPIVAKGRSTNVFLPKGGRLYLDVGDHPEYATAECDQVSDLLAQIRAGHDLIADLAAQANRALVAEGIDGTIHIFRNNADSRGNSYGCHENYLIGRHADFHQRVSRLVPFFVTRQIVVGSGYLKLKRGRVSYGFSQRADQTWDAISSASTRSRPIINTRDEPHADAQRFRRMHVIVGDTNVCEAATLAKVEVTLLVLQAAEAGVLPEVELVDPMRAIREVCQDLSGTVKIDVVGHGARTAVEIQRMYLDAITKLNVSYSANQRYALDLWDRGLTAVTTGDTSAVDTELDWAIKKKLLDRQVERGVTYDSMLASRLMLAYHDITAAGLSDTMESRGMMRRITTPSEVEAALTTPPATTRAHLRGRFIAAAEANRRDYSADWTHVRLRDDRGTTLRLDDPYATSDPRVDELIALMPRSVPDMPWC
ncbi:MAG: Pup--protein ligase [Bowdeniella nasicola]|nr:Pup--protein ligase [Bowdeniella nasicola]